MDNINSLTCKLDNIDANPSIRENYDFKIAETATAFLGLVLFVSLGMAYSLPLYVLVAQFSGYTIVYLGELSYLYYEKQNVENFVNELNDNSSYINEFQSRLIAIDKKCDEILSKNAKNEEVQKLKKSIENLKSSVFTKVEMNAPDINGDVSIGILAFSLFVIGISHIAGMAVKLSSGGSLWFHLIDVIGVGTIRYYVPMGMFSGLQLIMPQNLENFEKDANKTLQKIRENKAYRIISSREQYNEVLTRIDQALDTQNTENYSDMVGHCYFT